MVTSEYVPIKTETLKAFAGEVRRFSGRTEELTTAEMTEILRNNFGIDTEKAWLSTAMKNYQYEYSSGSTTHSRMYTGTAGNTLLLLLLHRGELVTSPAGWNKIGELVESGSKSLGLTNYIQYVSVFSKECEGTETIDYKQTVSGMTITCVIEFSGISGFEVLENTRMENVTCNNDPQFTCKRSNACMAIWITDAIYFANNTYNWKISDEKVWAISDNNGTIQPRLGVFIDNRIVPLPFTISSGMTGSDRYISAICIQVIP